ncbi:MAG: alpha/beta fold hydrolase, partial [Gammaproteobacteria bacterium]|nr:alpha/beta fold hydrolase [Gemmatimonadota bacterium]NIR35852.1 alpha/beta fold hydrolase [Actinomycetota bacterium]NIU73689.1 alpha/beta fold hydrolase [Gammaproteobacteria bacterium]
EGPALVLVHGFPGSSRALEPLIAAAARKYSVIAPDLPGHGESEDLERADPTAADYARSLFELLDELGVDRAALYGTDAGAAVAAELATLMGDRAEALVLGRPELYRDPPSGAAALPDLTPEPAGSHLVRAWSLCRDLHLYRPWYDSIPEHRVPDPLPAADAIHDEFVDLLRSGPGYGRILEAAAQSALSESPTFVLDGGAGLPDEEAVADQIRSVDPRRRPAFRSGPAVGGPAGDLRRSYVQTGEGRLLLRSAGGSGLPIVLLHASPTSGLMLEPLARRLTELGRTVLLFDTPGNGDS